ncbi:MAG TPA: hypothetical protein VEC11_08415 [Allosphingosinicella sp.]|nr:hypothetical protein [Allosphingosinicella sp.]
MTGHLKQPGATGVPPWIDWKLTKPRRRKLQTWLEKQDFTRLDEEALFGVIESEVRAYVQTKALAKQSSAGAVRNNLSKAVAASEKLLEAVQTLDGNSQFLLITITAGESLRDNVARNHRALVTAHAAARANYPLRGRRPEHESQRLAAVLAEAFEMHTSGFVRQTKGGKFEQFLRQVLALVGEERTDLHTLVEQVSQRQLITPLGEGLWMFTPYEFAPKRSQ